MPHRTQNIKENDTKYFSQKIVDLEEHLGCVVFGERANCATDSLEVYMKLRKAGAVRVKGKRYLEREINDPRAFHYWVENKGMVFDRHGGVQVIIDKESYYKLKKITDVSIAEHNGYFKEELPITDKRLK
jgi:hypothetical protein